jgi:hypothetical protein
VVLESAVATFVVGAGVQTANVLAACDGSAISTNFQGTQNGAAPFTLMPPVACRAVCGSNAFSLRQGATYLFASASGAIRVATPLDAEYSPEGASWIATRQTVEGVTGWVLSPANGYAAGWVLTRDADTSTCTNPACCLGASNNGVTLRAAPVPAGGLTKAHVWKMMWEDGSGDVAAVPAAAAFAAAPACPTASVTPLVTSTASPSNTASNTPSPSNTPSNTASPSGTQISSLSNTPSTSLSSSITPTSTASPSTTGTPTPTATSSSAYRVAGKLWIDLNAADFDDSALTSGVGVPVWDNRATVGAISPTNGDFVGLADPATWPRKVTYGFPGMAAVLFNHSTDGVADRLFANHSSFPGSNSFYGASDWSLEAWINTDGWNSAGFENGVFQWGPRNAQACQGASLGIGSHGTWGAGGHWACDHSYNGPSDATELIAGAWYQPTRDKWHHVVLAYTGPSHPTAAYTYYVYVDGTLMRTYTNRVLAIVKVTPLMLGAHFSGAGYTGVDIPGRFALARLRMHDGFLTAADITYNYLSEGLQFQATPSTTQTPSSTPSVTASPSNTPSNTGTPTQTPTATQVESLTPTRTPSATPPIKVASSLLIDLRAEDYDDTVLPGQWRNRASTAAFSNTAGHFQARSSSVTVQPSKTTILGAPAVVFNNTADGVADSVESASAWFSAGMYGGSDWSLEAWVYVDVPQSENPVIQVRQTRRRGGCLWLRQLWAEVDRARQRAGGRLSPLSHRAVLTLPPSPPTSSHTCSGAPAALPPTAAPRSPLSAMTIGGARAATGAATRRSWTAPLWTSSPAATSTATTSGRARGTTLRGRTRAPRARPRRCGRCTWTACSTTRCCRAC